MIAPCATCARPIPLGQACVIKGSSFYCFGGCADKLPAMASNPKSSKWYSTPRTDRPRRGIELTLSDEARAKLDVLAKRYGSRSAAVEYLIMEAK